MNATDSQLLPNANSEQSGLAIAHANRFYPVGQPNSRLIQLVGNCCFAIMNNHLHLLLRLDPQAVDAWSAEEVIRRSIIAYRPKTLRGEEIEINQAWIDWTIS